MVSAWPEPPSARPVEPSAGRTERKNVWLCRSCRGLAVLSWAVVILGGVTQGEKL